MGGSTSVWPYNVASRCASKLRTFLRTSSDSESARSGERAINLTASASNISSFGRGSTEHCTNLGECRADGDSWST